MAPYCEPWPENRKAIFGSGLALPYVAIAERRPVAKDSSSRASSGVVPATHAARRGKRVRVAAAVATDASAVPGCARKYAAQRPACSRSAASVRADREKITGFWSGEPKSLFRYELASPRITCAFVPDKP